MAQSQNRLAEFERASQNQPIPPADCRDRFAVLDDGATRLSSLKATSGTQTQDSPPLTLRGAYWTGSASVDLDWKVRNDVTGSNASRLAFTEPGGNDRVAILDSGDIYLPTAGKGVIVKTPDGTKCYRIYVEDDGSLQAVQINPCP
jgi:hypothetical protein